MKKLIFTLSAFGLMIASASVVSAQDVKMKKEGAKKAEFAKHKTAGVGAFEKLNLTDAQKSSIKAINEKYKTEMQSLMKKEDITVKAQRESRKSLMEKKQKEIASVLTAEQKAEFEKMKADRKRLATARFEQGKQFGKEKQLAKGKQFRQRGGMQMRDAYLKDSIGLSDSQLATLKAEREKTQAKMKAIKENTALSAEQKKEQFKAAMTEQKAALDKVLTAEQKEKMQAKRGFKPRMAK